MSEELKRRSRLATALIAGPVVTVGMLGAGVAPVMAEDDTEPQDQATEANVSEDPDDDGGETGEDSDDQSSEGGNNDPQDAGNEGDSDTDSEEVDADQESEEEAASEDEDVESEDGEEDPEEPSTLQDETQEPDDDSWLDNAIDVSVDPDDEDIFAGDREPYLVAQDAPASPESGGNPAGYLPEGDIVAVESINEAGEAYIYGSPEAPGVYVQNSSEFLSPYQQDDDGGDGEDEVELQEVTPEAPERYDNTVVIPEVEGVTYQDNEGPVEAGSEIELTEDEPSLFVTAYADEGFEISEDAQTSWSFQWQAGYEDTWPIDPPEGWEVDEDRWYANVPDTHVPEGYADWILELANNANQNADGWQEFETDTQVHLEPNTDAETIGDAFPTDGAVWWGYLEDQDFWMIVHQYTGATGFLPGESHLGEEPPVDGEASISVDANEVEAGDVVTVTGGDFEAGEEVNFTLSGTDVGSATADGDGNITTTLTIPEDTEPGDYTLTAVGEQSESGDSVSITVIDPDDEDEVTAADLTLDVTEVEPGGEVTVVGEGFEPDEEVEFSLNPVLDTFQADGEGTVTGVLTIPEDTEPGEHTLTAEGLTSGIEGEAELTVLDVVEVDPNLIVDQEEIALEDFIGDAEDDAGVDHYVEGLEPGTQIDYQVTGPEGIDDLTGVATADDEGNADFVIYGFELSDPSVYLGDYTTVVTYQDEDDETGELPGNFSVVAGTEDAETGVVHEDTEDEEATTEPAGDPGEDQSPAPEPAGDVDKDATKSAGDVGEDELATTGLTVGNVGLVAGLLLLIGGGLAALGFKNRLGRRDA